MTTQERQIKERTELTRLRTELVEMRKINKQQMAFLQDAAAFIRCDWSNEIILSTLMHDIRGLANDEPCFSPRVTGYAEREKSNSSKLL